jgi:hypothetical protein
VIRETYIREGTRVVSHAFDSGLGTVVRFIHDKDAVEVQWDSGAYGSCVPTPELTGLEEA